MTSDKPSPFKSTSADSANAKNKLGILFSRKRRERNLSANMGISLTSRKEKSPIRMYNNQGCATSRLPIFNWFVCAANISPNTNTVHPGVLKPMK